MFTCLEIARDKDPTSHACNKKQMGRVISPPYFITVIINLSKIQSELLFMANKQ